MPSKILGLDISEDAIAAVQIQSGLKGYQVMACSHIMVDREDGKINQLFPLFVLIL